jgi:hypothetical protein
MNQFHSAAACAAIILSVASTGRAQNDDLISTRRDGDSMVARRDDDLISTRSDDDLIFSRRDDDLISTRRDDDLISSRRDDDLIAPLDSHRTEPRETLQQRVERELDRGNGRIEDEPAHELDRMALERAERSGELHRSTWQRLEDERDRQLRLEQREHKAQHTAERQRILERESEKLHAKREAFYRSIGQGMTSGAADDTRKLNRIDREYNESLQQVEKQRGRALDRARADKHLSTETRDARIMAIERRFERKRQALSAERAQRRQRILGEAAPQSSPGH